MRDQLQQPRWWAGLTAICLLATIVVVYLSTSTKDQNPCDAASALAGAAQPPIDSGGVKHGTVTAVEPYANDKQDKMKMHKNDVGFRSPICVVVAGLPQEPDRGQLFLLLNGQRMQKIVGN